MSLSPPPETPQWAECPGPFSLLAPLYSPLPIAFDFLTPKLKGTVNSVKYLMYAAVYHLRMIK